MCRIGVASAVVPFVLLWPPAVRAQDPPTTPATSIDASRGTTPLAVGELSRAPYSRLDGVATEFGVLAPDPSAVGSNVFWVGSHGHFALRTADLYLDDATDFNQSVAVTTNPFSLRGLHRYDMQLDPVYDLDPNGFSSVLSGPGTNVLEPIGNPTPFNAESDIGDPTLFIDFAAYYDDNESDQFGGFWANWKLRVRALRVNESGGLEASTVRFNTPLRGPFWSGEKLEVADTGDSFRPQTMYYANMGVWNWDWLLPGSGFNEIVLVEIWEGDGGFFDDHIVSYIIHRGETSSGPVTISDTGDLVDLSVLSSGQLRREVTDGSGVGPGGLPRALQNPDNHDVDVTFATRPLSARQNVPADFRTTHIVGPNRFKGAERVGTATWESVGFNGGPQAFRFIDNVSYTPGWDCEGFPYNNPFDVDDDFQFTLTPTSSGVDVATSLGGCEGTTTVFFRANEVTLPAAVQVRRPPAWTLHVPGGSAQDLTIPRTTGMQGFALTELLSYHTSTDDDFGFKITKSETPTTFDINVSAFGAGSDAEVVVRVSALEWPPGTITFNGIRWDTQAAASGAAHRVMDVPVLNPGENYFTVHEILTYEPSGDDDMSWSLYLEPLDSHVNMQLASGNSTDSGAYVEAEMRILQAPDITTPVLSCPTSPVVAQCSQAGGAVVQFTVDATDDRDPSPVVTCSHTPGSVFPLGDTVVACTATDAAGNQTQCTFLVRVRDTTPPTIACPTDITVQCTTMGGTPADHPFVAAFLQGVSAADVCDPEPVLSHNAPSLFLLGTNVVVFAATDGSGNAATCEAIVAVVDTIPPTIAVAVDRYILWPPNHAMVLIQAAVVVSDICDPNPSFVLTSAASSEPDNGNGDGNTTNDIQGVETDASDIEFSLRAERAGTGTGRIYTIAYSAMDCSGNEAVADVVVRVPHHYEPGTAFAADGFSADGSEILPGVDSCFLVVPDSMVEGGRCFVGNSEASFAPVSHAEADVQGDPAPEMVLEFDAADLAALFDSQPATGDVWLHYERGSGGDYFVSNILELGAALNLEHATTAPTSLIPKLTHQAPFARAAPNPFLGGTRLSYGVPGSSPRDVRVDIVDVTGRRVRELVRATQQPGIYELGWDGRGADGSRAPAGIYFYRAVIGGDQRVQRIVLLR